MFRLWLKVESNDAWLLLWLEKTLRLVLSYLILGPGKDFEGLITKINSYTKFWRFQNWQKKL